MKRKVIVCLLFAVFLLNVSPAEAQQPQKVHRLGYLSNRAGPVEKAFRESLRELGYVEGRNIVFEWRHARGKLERFSELVADLLRLKVDAIVVTSVQGALAAKQATQNTPIVIGIAQDPVENGLVASLARPGGNVTGLTDFARELAGKRLGIFKQAVPRLSNLAVLSWKPAGPDYAAERSEIESAARALGIQLQPMEASGPDDLEKSFATVTQAAANGFIGLTDTRLARNRKRIVELTIRKLLPAIFQDRLFAEAGGLMSYGTNRVEWRGRMAVYVDKILKGAKPADLPVEQPTKFEFVINLKTAKQIGLTIPPTVLYSATKVIK